jgi:hypothetical protein
MSAGEGGGDRDRLRNRLGNRRGLVVVLPVGTSGEPDNRRCLLARRGGRADRVATTTDAAWDVEPLGERSIRVGGHHAPFVG